MFSNFEPYGASTWGRDPSLDCLKNNLNVSKPSNQSKGLGGNIGCVGTKTLHGIKRVPKWSHIGSKA